MTPPASARSRWRRWRFPLILLAGLICFYTTRGWYLPLVGGYLDVSEPPRPADGVFILGGDASTRPFVAAGLLRAGLARQAVFAAVESSPEARDGLWPADHELTRRVLLARGVPSDAIVLLPEECSSTLEEGRAFARFLEAHPRWTVTVVTSDYHTRRTRMLFRGFLGENEDRVRFAGAPVDAVHAGNWWKTERGVVLYTQEYLKLLMYTVR